MIPFTAVLVLSALASEARCSFIPWDPLTNNSWIYVGSPQTRIQMYTVNNGAYQVGFDQDTGTGSARGENALRFSLAGNTTGHMSTSQMTGSFGVTNIGGSLTFTDLLILVAINAPSLGGNFSMSLGVNGESAYQFNPASDFSYYSQPGYSTGRPCGYYSATSPTGEGLSYDFSSGMVSIYAAQNVNLAPSGTVTFNYSLASLPGTASFSVYGYVSSVGWIYHTNRGVLDNNSLSSPVSTLEVVPVPEPGTLSLILGGLCLAMRRKRRRKVAS
jgi:hypothetical protein